EKPMARTSRECVEMADAARKAGVKLGVCHNYLFHPVVGRLKEEIDRGGLVTLRTSFRTWIEREIRHGSRGDWLLTSEGGGVLWESGYHAAYIQRKFLGNISRVNAVAGRVTDSLVDSILVILKSTDGILGEMDLSWASKEIDWNVEAMTKTGDTFVADLRRDHLERRAIPSEGYVQENVPKLVRELRVAFEKRVVYGFKSILKKGRFAHRSHYRLIGRMLDDLRDPNAPPPATSEDGIATVRLLERIETSLRKAS
ncbi:MAG: Gfo/Idh/MocA family protein, partial [Thermoplasmata archaeon]